MHIPEKLVCPAPCNPSSLQITKNAFYLQRTDNSNPDFVPILSDENWTRAIEVNSYNPPGIDYTGDVLKVDIMNAGGNITTTWTPGDKTGFSNNISVGESFKMVASDDTHIWYDAGNCKGQAAAMKPSLQVSLVTFANVSSSSSSSSAKDSEPLGSLGLYLYSDKCVMYSYSNDNVSVALVPSGNLRSSKLDMSWLNDKKIEYTVTATWPDQTNVFFGAQFTGGNTEINKQGPRNRQASIIGCSEACKSSGAFEFLRSYRQCRCVDNAKSIYYDFNPEDTYSFTNLTSVGLSNPLASPPKKTSPDINSTGFAYAYSDADRTGKALIYKAPADKEDDSMFRSACSQLPTKQEMKDFGLPQKCSFATLEYTNPSMTSPKTQNMLVLRFKAGSDPEGLGTSIYLTPFHSKNNLSKVCIFEPPDFSDFEAHGIITARAKYNAPCKTACDDPCSATHPCRGIVTIILAFAPTTSTNSSVKVSLLFSQFNKECGDLSDLNLAQFSSNAVRGIEGDRRFLIDPRTPDTCLYPPMHNMKDCDAGCQVSCTKPREDGAEKTKETKFALIFAVVAVALIFLIIVYKLIK